MGLPLDFLERARAALEEYDTACRVADSKPSVSKGQTVGADAATKKARKLIRHVHTLIAPHLASNPAVLREWGEARRLPSHHGSAAKRLAASTPLGLLPAPAEPPPTDPSNS